MLLNLTHQGAAAEAAAAEAEAAVAAAERADAEGVHAATRRIGEIVSRELIAGIAPERVVLGGLVGSRVGFEGARGVLR